MTTSTGLTAPHTAPPPRHAFGRYLPSAALGIAALGLIGWLGDPVALTAIGYLPIQLVKQLAGQSDALAAMANPQILTSVLSLLGVGALAAAAYAVLPRRPIFSGLGARTVHRIRSLAVAVAVVVPTGYAVTRLAWFVGIPLGISREFLQEYDAILANGAGLAAFALIGALLTWGLTRPWGERFPRWMLGLSGKRVPIGLARNSAIAVGFSALSAGAYFIRSVIGGSISMAPQGAEQHVAAWLPEMFWPAWGLALIVAGLAYAELRRRSENAQDAERTP